jgi:hypothetical protein
VDNEDETEQEETAEKRDPQKWSWLEFFSLATSMVAAYCKLWGVWLDGIADLMDKHQAYKDDREEFAERAAIEIEALTKTPMEDSKVNEVR